MNHRQRGFDLVYDIREEREFLLEELRLFLFLVVFVLALLPGDGPLVVDLERCDEHACEQQEIEPDGGRALVETLLHHDRQRFVADGLCGSRRQAADFERIGSGRHVVIEYRVVGDRAAPLRVVAHEPALYGVELRQRRVEDGESESERILPRGEVDGPGAVHVADEGRTPVVGGDDQFVADAEFGDDQPGVSAFAVEFLGVEADEAAAGAEIEVAVRRAEAAVLEIVVQQSVEDRKTPDGLGLRIEGEEPLVRTHPYGSGVIFEHLEEDVRGQQVAAAGVIALEASGGGVEAPESSVETRGPDVPPPGPANTEKSMLSGPGSSSVPMWFAVISPRCRS